MDDHRLAAAELLAARRARDEIFGANRDGFGEPGWDMMLYLLAQDDAGVSEEDLAAAIGAPMTTVALYARWASSRGLVEPTGEMVRLSDGGRALMCAYFDNQRGME